ncbi:hypothetical protein N7471_010548 [Penicillium samsonianum]|uniref:uncharacterized protein n=1 Tax=Penicillium samsonianum TaxID=1882272 RepID=UPI002546E7F2|nr:uncharacterized protein N7471_010548 [Penicillium samsonianum]KAJ6126055.1 hypothetical protein N7471_010548 [Penicillium samsonianum]
MASLGLYDLDSDDPDVIPDSQPMIHPSSMVPDPPAASQPIPDSPTIPAESQSIHTFPLPPVDQTYQTAEEGKVAINTFARPHGYAVTKRRSKTTKHGVMKTVRLICDRGRRLPQGGDHDRSPHKKRLNTTTVACECPFSMSLRLDLQSNLWHITIENPSHNHPPSPPSTHPVQRALELKHKKAEVDTALRLGRPTRQILIEIRDADPDTCLTSRDLYNARVNLNQTFLACRTPIQALLMELSKDGSWIFKYEIDDQYHVTTFFCMHKTSVAMLKQNHWVLSMDCTYKTNRYGLPLLDIVGFAATGQTFHVGFAFMRDEHEDTYEVVLSCLAEAYEAARIDPPYPCTILTDKERALYNAITTIFPTTKHMICLWHINMNIMKVARPLLAEQVLQARFDPSAPNRRRTPAQAKEDRQKTEWIDDCPEKFLHVHTAQYLHLNEIATSRAESAHWLIKLGLQASNNYLLVVLRSFHHSVDEQFSKIKQKIDDQKRRTARRPEPLYQLLYGRISVRAIEYTKETYTRFLPIGDDKPEIPLLCDCNSKQTSGFPCIHIIKEHNDKDNGRIGPDLFHQQWHLYSVDAPPIDPLLLIQDPLRVRRRGRPRGARNLPSSTAATTEPSTQDTSIHREPSSWESSRGQVRGAGRGAGRGRAQGSQVVPRATRGTGRGRDRGRGQSAEDAEDTEDDGDAGDARAVRRGPMRNAKQKAAQTKG